MKRGAHRKHECTLINFWFPEIYVPLLDQGVRSADTDRSKFIRAAIREKLRRHGVKVQEEVA